jgi:hypothetical protein
MATRRGPGDPVDPFASLPLGQTLSGERERTRDEARRELDESLGRSRIDILSARVSERAQTVLAEIQETPNEARRSADLAAMQRRLAADAEEARQRTVQTAREREQQREQRQVAERRAQMDEFARQAEERRLTAERREQSRRAEQSQWAEQALRDTGAADARRAQRPLDDAPDASTLVAIEQRLQRKVEAVQRALNTLSEDLTEVRQMLAKKAPAPTGNEEAPFCEGERHLDLGEDP